MEFMQDFIDKVEEFLCAFCVIFYNKTYLILKFRICVFFFLLLSSVECWNIGMLKVFQELKRHKGLV